MKQSINTISIAGLGKLGLPLAAALASRGFSVVGYDSDAQKIKQYHQGLFPFETHLKEYMTRYKKRVRFTDELKDVLESQITFVVVPTPSKKDGAFSIAFLKQAFRAFGPVLKLKKSYHLISVVSTVLPGDMDRLKAILERYSGKKCGVDFGLCYNPAFIALGNVIHNFLFPDFILIGESDEKAGKMLEGFYQKFCPKETARHRMNFVNAELTKIAVNTFVTMKISFGNTIARLCERLPQGNADVVTQAIGSDRRIGKAYLKGALGYGGPCFPRDNRAFSAVAKRAGILAHTSKATDRVNQDQIELILKFVLSRLKPKDKVAVLGLSYKPDTDVIEESQGIGLVRKLLEKGYDPIVYDPAALESTKKLFGGRLFYARSAEEAFQKADCIVITTAWKEFEGLASVSQMSNGHVRTVIDCWHLLKDLKSNGRIRYIPLGSCLASAAS